MSIIIELLALTSLAALIAASAIGVMHWLASRVPTLKWERRRELSLRTRKHSNNKGEMSKVKTMIAAIAGMVMMAGAANAAELTQSVNDDGSARGFGWQERARVCIALTEAQCKAVVELQSGGGDGAGGGAAGDGGSAGAAGGDGCGPR